MSAFVRWQDVVPPLDVAEHGVARLPLVELQRHRIVLEAAPQSPRIGRDNRQALPMCYPCAARSTEFPLISVKKLAPREGFEPPTNRLTAT